MRVLDLGAHDGFVSRWIADQLDDPGLHVDGIELHPGFCAQARERMADVPGQWLVGAAEDAPSLLEPGTYDAVVAYEVIEHVPDMAGQLLDACDQMVRPDGRVYISTPDGCFGTGNNPHHLRALRAVDLADLLRRRGTLRDMQVAGGVTAASYTPRPRLGEVAIYAGKMWQPWSPVDITSKGLGGSETAAVMLAQELAGLGWIVTVYGDCEACAFRDVIFRHWSVFDPTEPRDVVISSRDPTVFDRPVNARRRLLWVHDVDCGDQLTEHRAGRIDHVLGLSTWHVQHLADRYPFLREQNKLVEFRNGIDHARFAGDVGPRQKRVLYTSSPDRGLDLLLELWPRVKDRVPDAELAYCYTDVYDRVAERDPGIAANRDRIRQLSDQPGVTRLESQGQGALAQLMRESMVWCAPSWYSPGPHPFCETFCIGAVEAQAAGLVVVATNVGALGQTVRCGRLMDAPPVDDQACTAWVAEIVDALTSEKTQEWAQTNAPKAITDMGWDAAAMDLHHLIKRPPVLAVAG